ncbi:hypothetical protein I307_03974 [Cryptococcus deuterogattii 99/473]|uniref:Uncharacterized protein n=1 Tax=Cryptococcus deuterogattii Ram5 TaxID=1296110 RepID=A0A0D0V1X5_9TREE|nr:hypothetical protein I313_02554 [Cryptococcus deuterogattii Ram5]KIY56512.1 hypothetical protein I307_03974 [Cryptococcus deuterogattii 99/473]
MSLSFLPFTPSFVPTYILFLAFVGHIQTYAYPHNSRQDFALTRKGSKLSQEAAQSILTNSASERGGGSIAWSRPSSASATVSKIAGVKNSPTTNERAINAMPTSSPTIAARDSSMKEALTSSMPAITSFTPVSGFAFPSVTASPSITASSYKTLTSLIPCIISNANSIAVHSWEIGAFTETLLEVYYPELTPFGWKASAFDGEDIPWSVLKIAKDAISHYNWTGAPGQNSENNLQDYLFPDTTPHAHVSQALVGGDGSLGDPVSLIPAVWLLARFARQDDLREELGLRSPKDYAWAVGNQLDYLFNGPTSDNGTISQREAGFEVWSDMGYMIPPSLAYLGLDISNYNLLKKALVQFSLESSAMLDTDQQIYQHIPASDARLWATGNGWMAYGLMRDLASVKMSPFAEDFSTLKSDAEQTIAGVFKALFDQLGEDGLLPDYMLQDNSTLALGDTAGTALTVAAYYRFLEITPHLTSQDLTAKAEKAFDGVVAKIDDNGWVTHCVDPMGTYGWVVYPEDYSLHSPEGQAFAAKMWKARTDAGY